MKSEGAQSIRDVARHANVSAATVSRVINNSSLVRPETAAHVQTAIKKLGYDPMGIRRRGRQNGHGRRAMRTRSLAFLSLGQGYRDWFAMPVMAAAIGAATEAARRRGWSVVLDEMPDKTRLSPLLHPRKIDGAVIFVSGYVAGCEKLIGVMQQLRERVPIVWAMGFSTVPVPVDHVTVDNLGIGYLAQRHLINQGCRRLAYVGNQVANWPIIRWRWKAFTDAGVPVRTLAVGSRPDMTDPYFDQVQYCESMSDLVDRLAEPKDRPDGLFIPMGGDAPVIYSLLRQRGIEPQRDMAVVTCDVEQIQMAHLSPRPAVVDLQTEQIGYHTIRQLNHRMTHPDEPPVLVQVMPRLLTPEMLAAREADDDHAANNGPDKSPDAARQGAAS